MKFFLSPPTFLGVFFGKIENFPKKNTPAKQLPFPSLDTCLLTAGSLEEKMIAWRWVRCASVLYPLRAIQLIGLLFLWLPCACCWIMVLMPFFSTRPLPRTRRAVAPGSPCPAAGFACPAPAPGRTANRPRPFRPVRAALASLLFVFLL